MERSSIEFHIRGTVPTLQNNNQTVNPFNEYHKLIKAITAKKSKKTEEDNNELYRLHFLAAMYLDDEKHVIWPEDNINAMFKAAAKSERLGKDADKGLSCMVPARLLYSGPKGDPNKLWDDESFRFIKPAKLSGKTIMSSRPIFNKWELKFTMTYDSEIFDPDVIVRLAEYAGHYIGLSDWRPKYGRFDVVSAK